MAMKDIIRVLPNTFIPIFVAIDVFILIPVFISLTQDMEQPKRKAVIRDSLITAFIVSILFVALGEGIFKILGITSDDFKIGGGLVLLVFAIMELLKNGQEHRKADARMGVVPLGVPLIVGPAVLTTILVLVTHYGIIPTVISLIINLLIVWLSLSKAEKIIKILGKGGITGISKVMALLLASIAVMMIRLGIENIIKTNF